MNKDIINKYNIQAPRYTSYPPANYFKEINEDDFIKTVEDSNDATKNNVSFYIHFPYCRRLCHYCGCNSYKWKDQESTDRYVAALHKEIDLVAKHLDKNRRISQIHYGGGSPSQLSASTLKELNQHLLSLMPTIDKPEIAIECHPGFLDREGWEAIADAGFNRVSIGIQDTEADVLKAVNRQPSILPISEIFEILRSRGIIINLDFLYGLPYQTPEKFEHAIAQAVSLRPDRIVTFSYGHVPWVFKRQQILEKIGLPDSETKEEMATRAASTIVKAGYRRIGMDHFVLPDDELSQALDTHQLHRNFQGYCTLRTTGQVYAFGATGISQLDDAFAQNVKNIDAYIDTVNSGHLPVAHGYKLNEKEKVMREISESLMCNYYLDWNVLSKEINMAVSELKACTNYDEDKLKEMAADGLINRSGNIIAMAEMGSPFVRNVVAALDPLMVNTDRKFSKPI